MDMSFSGTLQSLAHGLSEAEFGPSACINADQAQRKARSMCSYNTKIGRNIELVNISGIDAVDKANHLCWELPYLLLAYETVERQRNGSKNSSTAGSEPSSSLTDSETSTTTPSQTADRNFVERAMGMQDQILAKLLRR